MLGSHVLTGNRVCFRFHHGLAPRMAVAGDFSDWQPLEMQRSSSGEFELEVGPLPPGDVSYKFITPTGWAYDPSNCRRTDDGMNSMLNVGGQRGELHYRHFYSPGLGSEVDYLTYLPPSYAEEPNRPYPVLILLGRLLEESTAWVDDVSIHRALDGLMAADAVQPMVVVMPGRDAFSTDVEPWLAHLEYLTRDLLDHVEAEYRTLGLHAIEGIGLGGIWALRAGLGEPERFCSVGALSAPIPSYLRGVATKNSARIRDARTRFRLACGSGEAELIQHNEAFASHLNGLQIPGEFITNDGESGWPLWTQQLQFSLGFHDYSFRRKW